MTTWDSTIRTMMEKMFSVRKSEPDLTKEPYTQQELMILQENGCLAESGWSEDKIEEDDLSMLEMVRQYRAFNIRWLRGDHERAVLDKKRSKDDRVRVQTLRLQRYRDEKAEREGDQRIQKSRADRKAKSDALREERRARKAEKRAKKGG